MDVTLPLAAVEQTMLAGVRFAAFFVIAPPFANRGIPGTVKAMLSIGLALAVTPGLEPRAIGRRGQFIGELVLQLLVGGALGFLVPVVFSAVQSAGAHVDLYGGSQLE